MPIYQMLFTAIVDGAEKTETNEFEAAYDLAAVELAHEVKSAHPFMLVIRQGGRFVYARLESESCSAPTADKTLTSVPPCARGVNETLTSLIRG